jgi:sugar lactone lactonase YvrE
MKKKILIGIGIVLLLVIGALTYVLSTTKKHSPAAVANTKANGLDITVNYCRPYKKGRIIFGDKATGALQPFGEYWRVGANEATTFTTQTPVMFNNVLVPAGKYALYAIPGPGNWTIALNTENDRWGARPPEESNDVLRTEVPSNVNANLEEQFLISFKEASDSTVTNLSLHWDNTEVLIPLSVAK